MKIDAKVPAGTHVATVAEALLKVATVFHSCASCEFNGVTLEVLQGDQVTDDALSRWENEMVSKARRQCP